MIRCLGIDLAVTGPGAMAVLEEGKPPFVRHTVALPERQGADHFVLAVRMLLIEHSPHLVVCERPWTGRRDPRPSVGMAQRERLGLVKLVCEQHGMPKSRLRPIYASTMKQMLTEDGRASKERVANAVRTITGFVSANEHINDAVALALVGLQQERVKRQEQEWCRRERAESRKRKKVAVG